jgi:MFS family permease
MNLLGSMNLLLRRPHLRRLWIAGTVSLVGDWLGFVALSLLALDRGGGPLALASVLAVHALPHALLSPVAGPVADRVDRRRLLIGANLVETALTLLMAGAALRGSLAAVQALVLVRSAVSAFVVPAETAALRRVVEPEELVEANTLLSTTWSVTYVLGLAAGGALAALGPALAIALDAASFAIAAILLLPLPAMRPEAIAPTEGAAILAAVPQDLAAAFRHAQARPALLRAVLAKAPVALAGGGGFILANLVANRSAPFGSAALSLGLLQAVRGAGTGAGPMLAGVLLRRGRSAAGLGVGAITLTFAAIAAFALAGPGLALLAFALLWGMGSGANWVLSSAELQRLAPDALVGRLAAIDDLGATVGLVLGGLAGGALAEATGSVAPAAWIGLALGVTAAAALFRGTCAPAVATRAAA